MAKTFNSSEAQNGETGNIIISGGGLAGLSMSVGLAKLGPFHVDVIECRSEWLQQGSAFGLAANGRKALGELFSSPRPLDRLIEKGIHNEEFDSHLLVWHMVRDALLDEAEKHPCISIHMGKTIRGYDDTSDPTQIEIVVEDVGNADSKERLKGSLLIAADGVYSNVRAMAGLEPAKFAKKTKWRGTIPRVPEGSMLEPFLNDGTVPLGRHESTKGMQTGGECIVSLFNFHPKVDRKMTFVMNASAVDLPAGTHPREIFRRHMPDPHHQRILEEVYGLADDEELRHPLAMAVIELPGDGSEGWGGKGRVLFAGDAAHAMRPASGLGGAMAFEDAVVLCRILKGGGVESLKTRESAADLVRRFEASRFDRVKIIWDDQWKMSEGAYGKSFDPSSMWTRDFSAWVKAGV